MQENNFEKQVQQKLDELKLNPSDSVWQNVYAKIKKEKRRWRELIILFVLFILCGGILLWFPGIKPATEPQQLSERPVSEKSDPERMHGDSSPKRNNIVIEENHKTVKPNYSNTKENITVKRVNRKVKNDKIIAANLSDNIVADFNKIKNAERINENKIFTNSQAQKSPKEHTIIEEDTVIRQHKKDKPDITIKGGDSSVVPDVVILKQTDQQIKKETTSGKEISSKVKKVKAKWEWGVSFSTGVSDISKSFLGSDFLGSGPEEKSYFADAGNFNSGIPQSGTDTLSNSSKKPYLIKPSLALSIGFFASRKVSKSSSLTLGLNYKPFSISNKVGEKTDSGRYYRIQGPINRYGNNYHFIELPVSISHQIGKFKKVPFVLNAGISISSLVASNALQFNNTSGVYYNDNSLFNKTQIGFNTGIFVSNKKNSILVGPHIYYGTTQIANEGLYKNAHFTYLGLHSKFLFRKK